MESSFNVSVELKWKFPKGCIQCMIHVGTWYFFFFFWLCHMACRILVPQPGTEPVPPAVEVQSLNHRAAREVPTWYFLMVMLKIMTRK